MKELSSLEGAQSKKAVENKSPKPALAKRDKLDKRPLITFFVTLLFFLCSMVVFKKYPLGDRSVLLSDLKAQYAPFLALLKSKISELVNVPDGHLFSYLTYSFRLGLGKNFIGTFGYYLASPFNLIYLFVDVTQIDAVIMTIIVSKLSLASAFMCMFISTKTEDKKTKWPVLIGIMYAYALYAQVFLFHIMWLDGYMLLPLILFFTGKFIKKQSYAGLVISLLVLFVSNYYIAYMVGIACFLYLCIKMFIEKIPLKKAAVIGLKYVLTAGFTALVTAVLLIPVGLDTIRNADNTAYSGSSSITYSPLTLLHMFILGEPEEFNNLLPGNYPFLFICLLVSMLMLIYFLSPVFKGRERKIHAVCFLGVLLSTALYPLDKAWHVFDDPNWFWHRQAFVFLPLFLVVALKVLLKIKELARKDIMKAMLIMYALVVIDYTFGRILGKSDTALFNLCFITAYAGLIAGFGITNWPEQLKDMPRMIAPLLSGIVCFELVFASPILSSDIEPLALDGGSSIEYIQSLNAEIEFGNYANTRNNSTGAFRAETEKTIDFTSKNYIEDGEAFFGGYNGIAFFNSNSNKKMHRFMKQLGTATNYNYFAAWHTFASPSIDSFFSVGSVSARKDLSFYRLEGEDSYGTGLGFYANDNFLPLAFAADGKAMDFDFYRLETDASEKDYFKFQNDWYRSMFPEEFTEDFFVELDEGVTGAPVITNGEFFNTSEYVSNKDLVVTGESDSDLDSDPDSVQDESASRKADGLGLENTVNKELKANLTKIYRSNSHIPIAIEYEFEVPSDNELYCSIATGKLLDGTKIYVNGVKAYDFSSNTYYSQMFRLGSFSEGETVKISFISEEDRWSYLNIRFAFFDNETFTSQMSNVDKTKVMADVVYDGYAKFNINGIEDGDTIITTIPAEDGWQLYIDGAPAQHKAYQNAFIAFDAPSGNHTAELVFTAPGLKPGAMVSCAGIVLLAAFIVIDKNISKKKEKQN